MKYVFMTLLFTFAARADIPAKNQEMGMEKGEKFEDAKARMIRHFDQQIQNIQSAKDCVTTAKVHQDMKACRDKLHESRRLMIQGLKAEHGERMDKNMADKMDRMKARKARFDNSKNKEAK